MKQWITIFACLAMVLLMVTGCRSETDDSSTTTTTTTTAVGTSTVIDEEDVTTGGSENPMSSTDTTEQSVATSDSSAQTTSTEEEKTTTATTTMQSVTTTTKQTDGTTTKPTEVTSVATTSNTTVNITQGGVPVTITVPRPTESTVQTTTTALKVEETFGILRNDGEFHVHPFYSAKHLELASKLKYIHFLDEDNLTVVTDPKVTVSTISKPDTSFTFVHESAVIEYKGTLFAAWYSCEEKELEGYTPIHGVRSTDGGKTWSQKEVWAHDPSGEEMYCPPVFGICDDTLYMLVNSMKGFDNITALELYKWNEQTQKFDKVWRKPMCFKINTNVVTLSNGTLMIPGRSGEMGKNPLNPAVLISESGKIDGDWKIVTVDPEKRTAPETTVFEVGKTLYMISRSDSPEVMLTYVSKDHGKTWSEPATMDIPFRAVKMYAGTLSDGRNYIIGNSEIAGRTRVSMYVSEKDSCRFTKQIVLYDLKTSAIADTEMCHYPCAYESNGKLYISITVGYKKDSNIVPVTTVNQDRYSWFVRGLNLFTLNIGDI